MFLFSITLVDILFFQTHELKSSTTCDLLQLAIIALILLQDFFKAWGNLLHLFSGLCTSETVETNTICNGQR